MNGGKISCESGPGLSNCVNGTCENSGDSGTDFGSSSSGSYAPGSAPLEIIRDDVDELNRRIESLETRIEHLPGKR